MKKSLVLLLAIVLLMSMAACGNTNEKVEKHCWNCGEGISSEVSFCGYCGAAVKDNSNETTTTTAPTETTAPPDSLVTTAPSNEETQLTEQPTETQKPTESQKPTETQKPTHTHSYSQNVTAATCTEKGYTTYTCSCGDTYKDNYTNPSHNYQKNVCTKCGGKHDNYYLYQSEYDQLTADYNAEVAELQSKIATSLSNIEELQWEISTAQSTIAQLDHVIQVGGAISGPEYFERKSKLELTISTNTSKIQSEEINISVYNSEILTLTNQYNANVDALKVKYGM